MFRRPCLFTVLYLRTTADHAVQNVVALNAVDDDHGDVAGDQREEQPAEFAVRHVAEVGHPFDFFRRTLHHFDTEYFQRAAAAPYWRIMPITGTASMRT